MTVNKFNRTEKTSPRLITRRIVASFSMRAFTLLALFFISSCSAKNPDVRPVQSADTVITHRVGETEVSFRVRNFKNAKGKVYIILHDDENTAVEAADSIVSRFGGTMIELRAKGTRMISFKLKGQTYTFDPNRIFTPVGVKATLLKNGRTSPEAEKATGELGSLIAGMVARFDTVIAVHNNKRGYSLKDYLAGGAYEKDVAEVNWVKGSSPNDFYFVVERDDFDALKAKGINVVIQSASSVTDDGSLSVYCQQKGIRYLNCEAFDGHLKEQIFMLKAIF